ncbi:MAG: phosphoribosylglycinamide formyltransferase [Anaerolineales bacterium]|nr:phosphoribosylglycinamide formyltransferase [Anaerolineales bacterium]
MSKPRLVIMVSGSGTNLQALLDAILTDDLTAVAVLVVSNKKSAYGLVRAQNAGIPTLYFPTTPFRQTADSRAAYDRALAQEIKRHQPDLIVLAGWMRILTPHFLDQFPQQVINLHPALPGQFAGTHAIERAFEAFQQGQIQYSGCMVHYVIPEVDAGPVLVQAQVPLYATDTLDDFAQRMHATEHRIIVEATAQALQTASSQETKKSASSF